MSQVSSIMCWAKKARAPKNSIQCSLLKSSLELPCFSYTQSSAPKGKRVWKSSGIKPNQRNAKFISMSLTLSSLEWRSQEEHETIQDNIT